MSVPCHSATSLANLLLALGIAAQFVSDGASCAVDDYGLMGWAELLDLLTTRGPEELIRRVRAVERADPDRAVYPRSKRHDDATAAICVFGE